MYLNKKYYFEKVNPSQRFHDKHVKGQLYSVHETIKTTFRVDL